MLNTTLLFHLSQYAAEDIQKNLYADNIVTGCNSEEAATPNYFMVRAIMRDANFILRSWTSNSYNLMEQARKDETSAESGPIMFWDYSGTLPMTQYPSP